MNYICEKYNKNKYKNSALIMQSTGNVEHRCNTLRNGLSLINKLALSNYFQLTVEKSNTGFMHFLDTLFKKLCLFTNPLIRFGGKIMESLLFVLFKLIVFFFLVFVYAVKSFQKLHSKIQEYIQKQTQITYFLTS